jgi:hypothetical protein
MLPSSEQITRKLDRLRGERGISTYLKQHPQLVFWTFFTIGGHSDYLISEFSLGKRLKADFVAMQSDSGGWHVTFVELEPVDDPLFNRDGTPTRRLRIAQSQILDWQHYSHYDGPSLRAQLAEAAQRDDILGNSSPEFEPSSYSGIHLRDPMSYVQWEYWIVIGRRKALTDEKRQLRSALSHNSRYSVRSYDMFADTAKRAEEYRTN